ncbi:hypothetical protein AVEN_258687-1, partial [Araneus ventricosus]
MSFIRKECFWGESTVVIESISHKEEDIDESKELIEDLDIELDLEFEGGLATDAMCHFAYAENNSVNNVNETMMKIR